MEYTEEEKNLIVLSSFAEISVADKNALVSALKSFTLGSGLDENLLIKRLGDGVYNKVRDKFYDQTYRDKVFGYLKSGDICCVTLASKDYPKILKEIPTPPLVLFTRGRRELLNRPCLAVVGSRVTPPKTLAICKRFASELSREFCIVTGSATGADTAALEGAGQNAISVLAFGFDSIKSQTNCDLLEKVASEGLLVSEYFPNVTARSYFFPVRNRIIAGLAQGTLVVSAAKKSGALITADYAADYNREVFAIPYSLGITSGEGCNLLIKKGANICLEPKDVFEVFGIDGGERRIELSAEEQEIYSMIRETGEAFVPDIAARLGVPPFKLLPVLSSLEIKGLVIRGGGNKYHST